MFVSFFSHVVVHFIHTFIHSPCTEVCFISNVSIGGPPKITRARRTQNKLDGYKDIAYFTMTIYNNGVKFGKFLISENLHFCLRRLIVVVHQEIPLFSPLAHCFFRVIEHIHRNSTQMRTKKL